MEEVCPRCGGGMVDGVCPSCGHFHTLVTPVSEGEALAGRYILLQLLGRGGMGLVYLANDTHLGQHVAIKLLPAEISGDISAIEALKKEVLLARELRHENIAAVYNLETDPDRGCFIVMEFIDGADLTTIAEERRDRRFSLGEVLAIGDGIAAALDYAHKKKIVHRDIKPKNIMLTRDGAVKVTDFGIARRFAETMQQTRVVGTLPYMAPELLRGRPPTPAADIYALSATLYELLAGHPPFHKGDIHYKILNEQPPPIEGIPQEVNHILRRGLSKSPSDRYPTASSLSEAFHAAAGQKPDIGDLTLAIPRRKLKIVTESPPTDLINRAKEAEGRGDFSRALAFLRQAMRRQPKEELRELIYTIEKRQKEYYRHLETGDEAASAGRYKDALEAYKKAQKIRDSEMLRGRMAAAAKGWADSLAASAEKALRHHNLQEASRLANEALSLCSDHQKATEILATVESVKSALGRHLEEAKRALREHDYDKVITAADAALQLLPNHPEALALKKDAQKAKNHIETLLHQVEEALSACRHAEAVRLLEEVSKLKTGNDVAALLEEAHRLASAGSSIRTIQKLPTTAAPRSIAFSQKNILFSSNRALHWKHQRDETLTIPLPRTPLHIAASDDFIAFTLPKTLHILPSSSFSFLKNHSAGKLRPPFTKPHWTFRPLIRGLLLLALTATLFIPTLLLHMGLIDRRIHSVTTRLMLFGLPLLALVATLLVSPKRVWVLGWSKGIRIAEALGLTISEGEVLVAETGGLLRVRPADDRGGFIHFILWFLSALLWLFGLWLGVVVGLRLLGYNYWTLKDVLREFGDGFGYRLLREWWWSVPIACALIRFVIFLAEAAMACGHRIGFERLDSPASLAALSDQTIAFAVGTNILVRSGSEWLRIPASPETLHANGEHIAGLVSGDAVVWARNGMQVCRLPAHNARRVVVDRHGLCIAVLQSDRLLIHLIPHKRPVRIVDGVVCVDCQDEILAVGREDQIEFKKLT